MQMGATDEILKKTKRVVFCFFFPSVGQCLEEGCLQLGSEAVFVFTLLQRTSAEMLSPFPSDLSR